MALALVLQYVVIGSAVVASAAFVAQKQWPTALRKLRVACALPLLRAGSGKRVQALGRWIAPVPIDAKKECGSCDGCT